MKTKILSILVIVFAIILQSCGPDCDCEEIAYMHDKAVTFDTEEIFTGTCESKYDNGKTKELKEYRNGNVFGEWEKYYKNGQISERKIYEDEEVLFKEEWFENGQQSKVGGYKDDETYLNAEWYENGNKKFEENWIIVGKEEGYAECKREWYKDGQMKEEVHYDEKEKEISRNEWYENRQMKEETYFDENQEQISIKEWYKDGNKKFENLNKRLKGWHNNGQVSIVSKDENEIQVGNWEGKLRGSIRLIRYNEKGEITMIDFYNKIRKGADRLYGDVPRFGGSWHSHKSGTKDLKTFIEGGDITIISNIHESDLSIEENDNVSNDSFSKLFILGNNIWVRDEPSTGEVVMKLNDGDECTVLEKGEREQIRDMDDYWYKIEFDGKEGWVYGAQTSIILMEKRLTEDGRTAIFNRETKEFIKYEDGLNITYYMIEDPDGYTNMRKSAGGDIIRKVYTNEKFQVVGTDGKYKKVKFSNNEVGFIHESRVVTYSETEEETPEEETTE